jgi:hypothetical protein
MTEAISTHRLSKLDLFTPNRLHPTLPSLTLGMYMCMGNNTLMLSTPDVLARKAHVHGLLGDKVDDEGYLRRRVAAHDRLIMHMDIVYRLIQGRVRWIKAYKYDVGSADWEVKRKVKKSLSTKEAREEYVMKELPKQWEAMGLRDGRSEDMAITIE